MNAPKAVLNRSVFNAGPLASDAIRPLVTLVHRFAEVGDYVAYVQSRGRDTRPIYLHVARENAPQQINVDVAQAKPAPNSDDCCCDDNDQDGKTVLAGGLVGFYASSGHTPYTVRVERAGQPSKSLFDNTVGIPAGDLFCATLLFAGGYLATEAKSGSKLAITVERAGKSPAGAKRGQPVVVQVSDKGFSGKDLRLSSGQTVVFVCAAPAQIRIERTTAVVSEPPTSGTLPGRGGRKKKKS